MAIFSRRILQRMINENAKILTKEQLMKHIRSLNKDDESSLSTEWEVVLLYVFSKLGKVVHEPDLGGRTRGDLCFTLFTDSNQSFMAEICKVSDAGYEDENPREAFENKLLRIIKKYKLNN